jgi:hypothetical protein
LDSDTFVVGVLFDSAYLDRIAVEFNAIRVRGRAAYGAHNLLNVIELIVGSAGEVDIHRGPGYRCAPGRQQQGALQNEAVGVRGFSEPIQEPLHGEILEHFLKRPVLCAGLIEKALPCGCPEVTAAHSAASR